MMQNGADTKKHNITIKDVAKRAGVSVAVAGRAIGGYGSVSEEKRQKVIQIAHEMSYLPNSIAQSLRTSNPKTLGVVLSDIKNPFFSALLSNIEKTAREYGYTTIVCNTNEDIGLEIELLKTLYSKRVDGILLTSAHKKDEAVSEELNKFYRGYIPTVFLDREINGAKQSAIQIDNQRGGYEATKYLLSLGHTKIGIVSPFNVITVEKRIEGYRDALLEEGVPYDDSLVVRLDVKRNKNPWELQMMLDKHPDMTALFTLNTDSLMETLHALKRNCLQIPEDISVVSWDDCDIAEFLNITIVQQPVTELGIMATKTLLGLIDKTNSINYSKTFLAPSLVVRKSCLQTTQ